MAPRSGTEGEGKGEKWGGWGEVKRRRERERDGRIDRDSERENCRQTERQREMIGF